jgi:hypothetical protein
MIWLDLDGVMADFDGHYEKLFGVRPTRNKVDWKLVNSVPDFFRTIPLMPGARELFATAAALGHGFGMLTGCPPEIDASDNQKRDWVKANFPIQMLGRRIVCCRSRDKCLHGNPGDVLVDDYTKYRHLWEDMGGIFIHHTSAAESIAALIKHYRS